MEGYNDGYTSIISLVRALFGDSDIGGIIESMNGYADASLFLAYLFIAVFILLSMFLAILGEGQGAVREEQEERRKQDPARDPDRWIASIDDFHSLKDLSMQLSVFRQTAKDFMGQATGTCATSDALAYGSVPVSLPPPRDAGGEAQLSV